MLSTYIHIHTHTYIYIYISMYIYINIYTYIYVYIYIYIHTYIYIFHTFICYMLHIIPVIILCGIIMCYNLYNYVICYI